MDLTGVNQITQFNLQSNRELKKLLEFVGKCYKPDVECDAPLSEVFYVKFV